MKKRNRKLSLIIISIFVILGTLISINYVWADSGWDSSYDSGGGYSGGYSSGYSVGYSSYSNIGESGSGMNFSFPIVALCGIIFIIIAMIVVVILGILKIINNAREKALEAHFKLCSREQLLAIVPDFNEEEFDKKAFMVYKNFLDLWLQSDKEGIRAISSDKFYDTVCSALETRKNLSEVIKGITLIEHNLIRSSTSDNKTVDLIVGFKFKCVNYLMDHDSNKILSGDKDNYSYEYVEIEFNLDKDGKILIVRKITGLPYFSSTFFEKK